MNLVLLGMQQGRIAPAAGIVHRMIARVEYGWRVQNDTGCRRVDDFEADLSSCHDVLPNTGGSTTGLSASRVQHLCRLQRVVDVRNSMHGTLATWCVVIGHG